MTTRTIRQSLVALALILLIPAAHAQTAETPPAPPVISAPAPETSTPEQQSVSARPKTSNRFRVGPEVGIFLPTSGKARSQFGSSWISLGLGLGSIGQVPAKGQTSFDLQVLYQSRGDNHAFLAPLGVGYRKALSESGSASTYVGVTGDLYLADLRSADYNVHSGIRTGFGGSLLVGESFGDSGFLEARYLFVSQIQGFDLSGLNLTAGYRF